MKKLMGPIVALGLVLGIWAGCGQTSATPTTAPPPPPAVTAKPTQAPTLAPTRAPTRPPTQAATRPAEKPRTRTAADLAALPLGPERQRILEEGARQEGEVMVYSSATGLDSIIDDFMNKYPFIKADVFVTRVPALIERATAESKAGRLGGDIANGPLTVYTPLQDLVVKFNSPGAQFTSAPKAATTYVGLVVFTYSTRRVKPTEVPTRVEDLLNPRWKGKLGLFAPPNTFPGLWTNMLLENLGEAKARDFLTKLSGQDLFFYDSPQIAEKALGDGQIDLNMQGSTNARRRVGEGLPLNWTAPEPSMGYVNLITLFKDSKHPHAALLLIDYILSPEAQNKISGMVGSFTTREIAAGEIDGVKLPKTIWLQTQERVKNIPQGTKIFEQLVMKK